MKNVIFDFGNVVVDWNPYNALSHLFSSKEDMLVCFVKIEFYAWNTEQDRGRSWEDGFKWVEENHPEHRDVFRTYVERIQDAHRDPIAGMPQLIERLLTNQVNVLGLTNAADISFEAVRKTVPMVDRMSDIVVSAREGLVKPSKEIFELCLTRNGLNASETVFVDDMKANCEGAEAVGLHSHHFSNAERLTAELKRLGLL